jgi:tetrahydromethanopterin S-methyltransferase subunit G
VLDDRLRFHRATDWVTRDCPAVADLLFRCETVAIRITEVLRHASETIALRRVLAVASGLLGFLDRAGDTAAAAEPLPVIREQRRELEAIDEYYRRAGSRIGRILYTWGMLIGLAVLAGVLATFVLPLWLWGPLDWSDRGVQIFLISFAAGAIGAFISVLQRMATEKFTIHYDLGKRSLYILGSYRPVLGAVFGVFTYFLLASHLLQTEDPAGERALFFYGAVAFVAGFSERFTKVLVKGVEARFDPGSRGKDAQEPPAS